MMDLFMIRLSSGTRRPLYTIILAVDAVLSLGFSLTLTQWVVIFLTTGGIC